MQSAKVAFNDGAVTAELKDVGDSFDLEIVVVEPDPNYTRCLKLRTDKESVRRFLDVLLEAEETDDVPDPAIGGAQGQGTGS